MLIDFFVRIWKGYTCPKDNTDFKDSIESFKKEIEDIFMNPTNMELAYSSWDFTEIRDAISKTEDISDDNKVLLQELVAHMISIRDRYNVKELVFQVLELFFLEYCKADAFTVSAFLF